MRFINLWLGRKVPLLDSNNIIIKFIYYLTYLLTLLRFGLGVFQGLTGLVVKPLSGALDLVAKSAEGMKGSVENEDTNILQMRRPRVFYGRFKNVSYTILIYYTILILLYLLY